MILEFLVTLSFRMRLYLIVWNAVLVACTACNSKDSIDASSVVVDLLNSATVLLNDAKKYANKCSSCTDADLTLKKPMDCAEIKMNNKTSKSGIYNIWPANRIIKTSVKVYCDMEDDNGGWTVIQRRDDFGSAKDYFYRDWVSYKNGFGDLTKDFWLGNDNTFALTNERSNQIKITLTDWEGNTTYAIYDEFWIDDEYHKYAAHVMGYRGTAGDSFSDVNGVAFSTKDKDNDIHEGSCAVSFKGAWWYTKCHSSNLNGFYLKGPHESHADGVEWHGFRGHYYSLKDTVMKVRSIDYKATEKARTDITPQ